MTTGRVAQSLFLSRHINFNGEDVHEFQFPFWAISISAEMPQMIRNGYAKA
jgi:hypothetical protein